MVDLMYGHGMSPIQCKDLSSRLDCENSKKMPSKHNPICNWISNPNKSSLGDIHTPLPGMCIPKKLHKDNCSCAIS